MIVIVKGSWRLITKGKNVCGEHFLKNTFYSRMGIIYSCLTFARNVVFRYILENQCCTEIHTNTHSCWVRNICAVGVKEASEIRNFSHIVLTLYWASIRGLAMLSLSLYVYNIYMFIICLHIFICFKEYMS